jgi:predicted cupin superfamily sugar epimerase
MTALYWIEQLDLLPHPEGGYYKEMYRCTEEISVPGGKRNISTAIYFLLEGKNKSHFHRLKSDELWFFHEGAALEIFCLTEDKLVRILLGKNMEKGERLQAVIPAGVWFASKVKNETGYVLVSCTVAPGFDFKDFELGKRVDLLTAYPHPDWEKTIVEMSFE